ncbi:Crp/Fnr family transcriptional regulator [Rufibacter sp. LB8]|uniref:Crp/Fnr family transcriptional regulator n=1 Tax=Rufibacter sp. LB8 TaxID=2777781 RepID=UPI00178C81AB|nr:Crp/Fnr family transcriptional regulator [Rufibacter sp. LB8]
MNVDPLERLRLAVSGLYPLSEEDWAAFSALWKPFNAARKQPLTVAGDPEKYLYFILEGVQRIYALDEQEREATLTFTYPSNFGGVLDAFLLQKPSAYFYETLSASSFLRISYADLQPLAETSLAINAFLRSGLAHSLSGVLERLVELQAYSSEDKFRKLLTRSPHILQLVPHKYLANYLGIEATNFSKLLNKVKL